jgi:hypothetical protein
MYMTLTILRLIKRFFVSTETLSNAADLNAEFRCETFFILRRRSIIKSIQ